MINVDFPHELDITKFADPTMEETTMNPTKYELYCLISHTGSQFGGHYIAQCQDDTNPGKWHYYNDQGTMSTNDHVEKDGAYILFYKRNESKETNPLPQLDFIQCQFCQLEYRTSLDLQKHHMSDCKEVEKCRKDLTNLKDLKNVNSLLNYFRFLN